MVADNRHGSDSRARAGHSHDHGEADRRSLVIALLLISGFMAAEVVGGILAGSLALLSDAGHMVADAAAIGLALVAHHMARRPYSAERTFGYRRAEVLAAMLNALSLWLIAGWIFYEAYGRIRQAPEVEGGLLVVVGFLGLAVNVAAARVLRGPAGQSMNVEGAFRHVMADLMASVGVVVSGLVILATGWAIVDPAMGMLIGLLILGSAWRLSVKVFHVLMESVPKHIDLYRLCYQLAELPGVTMLHDVHVWTISSGHESLTAHVVVDPAYDGKVDVLIRRIQSVARHEFGISHITIQVEESPDGCTELHQFDPLRALERG